MGLPLSFEPSAAPGRVEPALAVSPEPQAETASGDQNQRPAVTGVSGEFAVSIDVGEAQAPGKVRSHGGLARDLESGSSSVPPGHGAVSLVFPELAPGLPDLPGHALLRLAICSVLMAMGVELMAIQER